jgi:hypothetical protein
LNIETLSDVPLYAARPSRAVAPKRKAASWIAVFIVHLFLLSMVIFSHTVRDLVRHGGDVETILDITGSMDQPMPQQKVVTPQSQIGTPPEIQQAPTPIIPPIVDTLPPEPQGGSQPKGDVLGGIGREIACSAGHFENLTEAQRARCERAPFQGMQLPTGELVLLGPRPESRFAPPPKEPGLSGMDEQRLRMQRPNTGCPTVINMPCVNQIPGMNDR